MARTRRTLITERDIRRAAREGTTSMDTRGATVTPSARDAARTLGVSLGGPEKPAASAGATRARGASGTGTKRAAPIAASTGRRVVVGADHGGVAMKDLILATLRNDGHAVDDVGTFGSDPVDYPDFALAVARAVAEGRADLGIMIDGAGIGSCMVANKVAGVRAALCYDMTTAANAREHNNANVLTLGGTLIGSRLAQEIVSTFLATAFGGGRHARRVEKIDALDGSRVLPGTNG